MKFARRSPAEDDSGAAGTAADAPPRGRPVSAFAGVLDGRWLWVAIEARPGVLTLRDARGSVLTLLDDAIDDQPGYTAAHLDLSELTEPDEPDEPATYDVVLVPGGTRKPLPVWTPPLAPDRSRPAPDQTTHHTLHRGADGTLQLRTRRLPTAVSLGSVSAQRDHLVLRLLGNSPAGRALAILGEDDAVLADWPVVDGVAHVTSAELDGLAPQLTRVVVGEHDSWVPVRRFDNGLTDPGRAAPLPQLYDGDADEPRLRLRWSGQGLLQLRVFERAAS